MCARVAHSRSSLCDIPPCDRRLAGVLLLRVVPGPPRRRADSGRSHRLGAGSPRPRTAGPARTPAADRSRGRSPAARPGADNPAGRTAAPGSAVARLLPVALLAAVAGCPARGRGLAVRSLVGWAGVAVRTAGRWTAPSTAARTGPKPKIPRPPMRVGRTPWARSSPWSDTPDPTAGYPRSSPAWCPTSRPTRYGDDSSEVERAEVSARLGLSGRSAVDRSRGRLVFTLVRGRPADWGGFSLMASRLWPTDPRASINPTCGGPDNFRRRRRRSRPRRRLRPDQRRPRGSRDRLRRRGAHARAMRSRYLTERYFNSRATLVCFAFARPRPISGRPPRTCRCRRLSRGWS